MFGRGEPGLCDEQKWYLHWMLFLKCEMCYFYIENNNKLWRNVMHYMLCLRF